ncbi:MAG: Sir2 family NAD-dependent protein deacetylase [Crocinitomicaceae bacterium]
MLKVVIFSGAGMSAESGISTFRDAGGLWENYRIEEVATPNAFRQNPVLVQRFYNDRRKQIIETEPNSAHVLIADLESKFSVTVITQNIDDLHERAGSSSVVHLHGNIRYGKSSGPNPEKKYYRLKGWEITTEDRCDEGYPLRPHVVWFGEEVPMLERAAEIIQTADYLIVIGTSLNVYPAAGLIHAAPKHCQKIIIDPHVDTLNLPSDFYAIKEIASTGLKRWIKENE